jgi:hypothetical protein
LRRGSLSIVLKRIADLDIVEDRGVKVNPAILTTRVADVLDDPEISIVAELMGNRARAVPILQAIEKGNTWSRPTRRSWRFTEAKSLPQPRKRGGDRF